MSVLDCQHPSVPSGWRIERQSAKSCVWFDDRRKRYKSSKQVEAALRERGLHGLPSETETETDTAFCDTVVILESYPASSKAVRRTAEVPARDRGESSG